ncbi:leucine-rich repeat-containing protein 74A-like [Rhopilema esculentum]|uniref:leucine-rich repeat-containing protein 74A-like n=1 Tax=Rhopilema esculentum TaxID=499914 RepID=UPI0031D93E7A|eukprot:gene11544-21773_t
MKSQGRTNSVRTSSRYKDASYRLVSINTALSSNGKKTLPKSESDRLSTIRVDKAKYDQTQFSHTANDFQSNTFNPGALNMGNRPKRSSETNNGGRGRAGTHISGKIDWVSDDSKQETASEHKNRSSGFSPRQRAMHGRMFSPSIKEEEEDEEQVIRMKEHLEDFVDVSDDECNFQSEEEELNEALLRVRFTGEIKKGTRSLSITDLEECPKASEEERDEENLDETSSDSDSLYDTDLEEEFSGRKFICHQTGKEIYEYMCKKEGLIPASFLLSRFTESEILMPHHGLGPEGGKAFAKGLVVNAYVERLDLSDNDLRSKGGMSFGFMLFENSYITDLDLSENAIGISGGIIIANALQVNKSIRRLILRGNQFTDKVAVAFAGALTENEKLHVLDLSYNQLGEMGGLYLGAGLGMNYGLAMLNLKWNAISGKGAVSIAHALSVNETLTSLNISWNSFGYTGAMALSTYLKKNESLKHLDLRNNHLNEAAILKLMPAVASHQSLIEIKVGQNPIGEAGVREIFEAVGLNLNIIHLGLEDISVPLEFLPTIQKLEKERGIVIVTDKKTRTSTNEEQKNGMDILMEFLQDNSLRLKDMFFRLDKDHSGDITREEFKHGLKEMGIQMDLKQLDKLINEIDKDNSDSIDYGEITQGHKTAKEHKRRKTLAKINLKKKDEASLMLPELDTIRQSLSLKDIKVKDN